jgi:hypothetical protein
MQPLFLSKKAEEGFDSLRADLQKLRNWNQEAIPEKHLRILNRLQALSAVVATVIIASVVIWVTWQIISSDGQFLLTRFSFFVADLMRLSKLVV